MIRGIVQRIVSWVRTKAASVNRYLQIATAPWQFGRAHVSRTDKRSQLDAYKSWVYVCSSRNASTFASTPLRLYAAKTSSRTRMLVPTRPVSKSQREYLESLSSLQQVNAVRKAVEIEEVLDHPWLDLLKNVNGFMSRFSLLELTDLSQELTGEAYWYIGYKDGAGLPREIWPLPVDRMSVVPSAEKYISHYEYRTSGMPTRFEPDEIIHFMWPDPMDQYGGMSPLAGAAAAYNLNVNMNTYETSLFANNTRLEGYFTTDETVSDAEFERIKTEVTEVYSGITNSGKSGLFDKGIKFVPINLSPRDLGFLQGRTWTKAEIFEAYANPQGLFDQQANRANADAALYHYMKFGIAPRHRRFEEKLNEYLVPLYDDNLFAAFDNCIPEDREFELQRQESRLKTGAWSRNEVRILDGKEPIDGADDLLVPFSLVPIGTPPEQTIRDIAERVTREMRNGIHV